MAEPRRKPAGGADARVRLIRAVRAACRAQGIGDDDRRAIQLAATGKASQADMDTTDLARVLDRLNRTQAPRGADRAHVGKVRALWWTLYWLGAIDQPDDRAIGAFVKRQTGRDALRFLDARAAHRVIEALKDWATREGVAWPMPGDPIADRRAVATAIATRIDPATPVDTMLRAILPGDPVQWPAGSWDEAIRALGKRWRRERAR